MLGHTRPGRHSKDIQIQVENGPDILIEVKGSQLIDPNKGHSRWQRVKLTQRDYAGTITADYFLFVFDTSQLGYRFEPCAVCREFDCFLQYHFVRSDKILDLVKDKTKKYARLSLLKILKVNQ